MLQKTGKKGQCTFVSKSTGKRCKHKAVKDTKLCQIHKAWKPDESSLIIKSSENKESGKKGNTNAIKHGAYSLKLLPEDETIYLKKKEAFTKGIEGEPDVYDKEIIHFLALITTKAEQAAVKGAEHATYSGMLKQMLDFMKELKATRASRSNSTNNDQVLTYADMVLQMKKYLFQTEQNSTENNLISRENQDDNIKKETIKKYCVRCRNDTLYERIDKNNWKCLNCGYIPKFEDFIKPEKPVNSEKLTAEFRNNENNQSLDITPEQLKVVKEYHRLRREGIELTKDVLKQAVKIAMENKRLKQLEKEKIKDLEFTKRAEEYLKKCEHDDNWEIIKKQAMPKIPPKCQNALKHGFEQYAYKRLESEMIEIIKEKLKSNNLNIPYKSEFDHQGESDNG